jgi:hypothetical protein
LPKLAFESPELKLPALKLPESKKPKLPEPAFAAPVLVLPPFQNLYQHRAGRFAGAVVAPGGELGASGNRPHRRDRASRSKLSRQTSGGSRRP